MVKSVRVRVEVLALQSACIEPEEMLQSLGDGRRVAVQQGHLLATAFHPELTGDSRLHQYFIQRIDQGS